MWLSLEKMEDKDKIESNELTNKQITAIKKSIQVGKQLQENIPEIADDYRRGLTLKEIVRRYSINSNYSINEKTARDSVRYAIVGHKGGLNVQSYEGIITDKSELERLCLEHCVGGGERLYEQGLGIHGRTAEQMSEDRHKGGRIVYEQGLGIHGRTAEQKSEDGCKGLVSRGLTLWKGREYHDNRSTLSELDFAFELSQLPEYKRGTKINNKLIAEKINELYHNGEPIRTADSIYNALYRFKKEFNIRK